MINDRLVIDAVAHAYDLSDENTESNRYAQTMRMQLCGLHQLWQPEIGLSPEEQCSDWPIEVMARTLFLESDVDLAVTHTLRLNSYFKDGLCARYKTVEAVRRWPQRFFGYVGLDPTLGLDTCLRELDEQMDEMPEAVGLKLYPAQVNPLRSWRMDDSKLAFPLFKAARDRGIKIVAIHKAAPLGPVPLNPFKLDDVGGAADAFPDLAFEIVHAGWAFMDETIVQLATMPNIYANLECTSAFANKLPGQFEQMMANFFAWGGPQKVIFSSGNMVLHSQPILNAFRRFRFSEETMKHFGIPQITPEDLALVLGGNFAALTGLDSEKAKQRIANDEFAQERRQTGVQAPYSNWRRFLKEGKIGVAA
ncbi:MAG: amidohydrolase family protein [Alphaproteobacteria bacterium]|nr:amidohydrolase family protein [Alphaproteobacteria bacterium]